MNDLTLLDVPSQINALDRPRDVPRALPRTALNYALGALGATYYRPTDSREDGPCARCGAVITRYGPTCTSTVCVACHVLEWVQS
jgi:hypothetical protein